MDLSPPKDLSKLESKPVPSAAAVKQDILPPPEGAVKTQNDEASETSKLLKNNLTEEKEVELMDAHEQGTQTEGKELRIRHIERSSTSWTTCSVPIICLHCVVETLR